MKRDDITTQPQEEVLFIAATHGNEPIGVHVLEMLEEKRNDFDWIIGSPPALESHTREFEGDLNRSAPGDSESTEYAKRRAAELIELSQKYHYTIDLHGSIQENGIYIILTNLTEENLRLATLFDIERIVYWPSRTPEMVGPMSEFFKNGLEIECGAKEHPAIHEQLHDILDDFLDNHFSREEMDWKTLLETKTLYEMVGHIEDTPEHARLQLKEFIPTRIDGEHYSPLFVGSYHYSNVLGYKLRKVSARHLIELCNKQ